jgi:hypothetical protein
VKALGPRIVFKPGVTGAQLFAAHLDPGSGVMELLRILALEAPELRNDVMVVTGLWRPATPTPSYHPAMQAADVRTGIDNPGVQGAIRGEGPEERYEIGCRWAARARRRLGLEFDLVYGREVNHVDHIHGEWDQKKRRAIRLG